MFFGGNICLFRLQLLSIGMRILQDKVITNNGKFSKADPTILESGYYELVQKSNKTTVPT